VTRTELAMGTATFLVVIAAGVLSETWLDRRFAAIEAGKRDAANQRPDASVPKSSPEPTPERGPEPPSVSGACVDRDGFWKNWSWSNVPMLSPKCGDR